MNIDKKLQKIHADLQEVTLEMEVSADRPKERKGDYVIMLDRKGREFIALLIVNPYRDDVTDNIDPGWNPSRDPNYWEPMWFVNFIAKNKTLFYEAEAEWDAKRKRWFWLDNSIKNITFRNWNPPKKLLRDIRK